MKNFLQDYFSFTKKELNGITVLCILIVLVTIFPWIYNRFQKPEVNQFDDFESEVKAFLASASKKAHKSSYSVRDEIEDAELKSSYFAFDPNGLDEISWRKLGLSPRQIRVIKNYENKGGRFYKKEDLQRMYSISARKYAELEPYIHIKEQDNFIGETYKSSFKSSQGKAYISKREPLPVVELNTADSAQLETLRGIGPVFASRIAGYRKRLGGFYKKEQLLDVYGFDSVKYEVLINQVKVDSSFIQKINVNSATFEDFKKHPYLTYKQMNAIVQYRKQHGKYQSIDDLKKIAIMNEEILRKIGPYLTY